MPTVSPINIEKQLLGTWKISENLKKEALFEIAECSDSDIDELDFDAFELLIQGNLEYNQSGKFHHKIFMQIFVSNDDIKLRLRYYIQQKGNWSYNESNAEISESCTEVVELCLDEETEELTDDTPTILEDFTFKDINDGSVIESLSKNELVLRDKETGLMTCLTRVCEYR